MTLIDDSSGLGLHAFYPTGTQKGESKLQYLRQKSGMNYEVGFDL